MILAIFMNWKIVESKKLNLRIEPINFKEYIKNVNNTYKNG